MTAVNLQPLNSVCRSATTSILPFLPSLTSSHHFLFKGTRTCQIWSKKGTSLWNNKRVFPVVTRCCGSGNSSSTDTLEQSSTQDKERCAADRVRSNCFWSGLEEWIGDGRSQYGVLGQFVGVDPLQAGNVVQLFIVLGMTVGWISSYMFRVANKDMTYAQQLRDYESKVMEKRLEGLTEAELQVLLEQIEEEKRQVTNSKKVN